MKHRDWAALQTYTSGFLDGLTELLGTSLDNIVLRRVAGSTTSIEVVASTGNSQANAAIAGQWRFNTATVSAAHPAGAAGQYPIHLTSRVNNIAQEDAGTFDYTFGLKIGTPSGTGAEAISRQIGVTDWDGAAIVGIRQTIGATDSSGMVTPVATAASLTPVRVVGAASQTAPLLTIDTSIGGRLLTVDSIGAVSVLGALTIARAGGESTALLVRTAGTANALFRVRSDIETDHHGALEWAGGSGDPYDTNLYRSASNTLATDDALTVAGTLSALGALTVTGVTTLNGNVRLGDADADTVGFFSVNGVARQAATTDLKDALTNYGLIQGTSASPLNLDGGALTSGALSATTGVFSSTLGVTGILTASATGKTAITIADSGAQVSGLTIGGDTNLYRNAANVLKTDDEFHSATSIYSAATALGQVGIGGFGPGGAAAVLFGSAGDTNLYRSAANTLKTDDYLVSATELIANHGTANAVNIGWNGAAAAAAMTFGSAGDTNLYRAAANILRTDDAMTSVRTVAGDQAWGSHITGDTNYRFSIDASGVIIWGSGAAGADTNLYRGAAGILKTDSIVYAAGAVAASLGTNQTYSGAVGPSGVAGITFGGAGDTNLYRSAANVLATDDALTVAGVLTASGGITLSDAGSGNIVAGTVTGTKIGTATTQKLGFWNSTPVVQPSGWGTPLATEAALRTALTTASTLDETRRYLKTLASDLKSLGLIGT